MARIAMLLDDDFEDSEYRVPFDRLIDAGHEVEILGSTRKVVKGKRGKEEARVTGLCAEHDPADYDAMVIPGGYAPDKLRMDARVVDLVRRFFATGKPIAAVCHGPQLLIEADVVKGHKVTSWPSVRTDLVNAGATWIDHEVVEDEPLITSRNPSDLEAFSDALIRRLARG
jgi:protease I